MRRPLQQLREPNKWAFRPDLILGEEALYALCAKVPGSGSFTATQTNEVLGSVFENRS
jgi:hypothetical protein